MTLCPRCKDRYIRVCQMGDAKTRAEFLGMCEPCYVEWISQFPVAPSHQTGTGQ